VIDAQGKLMTVIDFQTLIQSQN